MIRRIAQLLSTPSLVVALSFGAQACCGGLDKDEADKVLRVTIDEAPLEGEVAAPETQKLCGAEVIARGDDGEEIALEEIQAERGCEYVAEVNPDVIYTVSATHPERGAGENPFAESNPACSTPTAPEDIDNSVALGRPARNVASLPRQL